jgi:hypothetical protein
LTGTGRVRVAAIRVRVGYGYANIRVKYGFELTSATTSASSSTEKKNKPSRTEELSINNVLRSFSGKAEGSSDDEDFDPLDEIHDYMKKKIVFPKNGDILKWWQDHSIIYKLLSRLVWPWIYYRFQPVQQQVKESLVRLVERSRLDDNC